jgi:G3E family GTPase
MHRQNKIPVTIITGFLGAGKTTFINDLLRNNQQTRFALVENEFGDVAIDSKLIKGVEASQMFELKNGCICCTISDEYEQALAELAEKFQDVEHLLIETSGVADPAPVIRPFFSDEKLRKLYRFNGTVCLADAKYFHRYPAKKMANKQLAIADTVIITKTEDFSQEQKGQFLNAVKQFNPLAYFFSSDFGHVYDFDLSNIQHTTLRYIAINNESHENLQVKTIRFEKLLNKLEFADTLTYNLDLYKNEVYRMKGLLCFENEPYQYVLQGVGGSFELAESDELANSVVSEMVIIGNLKTFDLNNFILKSQSTPE